MTNKELAEHRVWLRGNFKSILEKYEESLATAARLGKSKEEGIYYFWITAFTRGDAHGRIYGLQRIKELKQDLSKLRNAQKVENEV